MGSSDYERHQGKEGRRRKTRATPRSYHHKVTVPHPYSSCQLSKLRSNHARLHRALTPRRPSLPLNPSATPSCSCRARYPQHTFQATATSINFFTRALRPPTPPSLRVRDPRRRPRASSNREKARSAMAWQTAFFSRVAVGYKQ